MFPLQQKQGIFTFKRKILIKFHLELYAGTAVNLVKIAQAKKKKKIETTISLYSYFIIGKREA